MQTPVFYMLQGWNRAVGESRSGGGGSRKVRGQSSYPHTPEKIRVQFHGRNHNGQRAPLMTLSSRPIPVRKASGYPRCPASLAAAPHEPPLAG
jgi:hypothetical protein